MILNDDLTKETSDILTRESVSKDLNNMVHMCEAENSVGRSKVKSVKHLSEPEKTDFVKLDPNPALTKKKT
jgi:hypothetical protein